MNTIKSLKITFEEIRAIVADNDKQRFSLIPVTQASSAEGEDAVIPTDDEATAASKTQSDNPADWLIRANQGHSIAIAEEELLEPLTINSPDLPNIVVHGTTKKAWPLILKTGGLKPMARTHVHFATGLPAGFKPLSANGDASNADEQPPVISGMRNSSTVLIYIDLEKALKAGLKFWKSANGVVLCSGNDEKVIPIDVFERVEGRSDKDAGLWAKDGIVLAQSVEQS